jgi:1-acyl-sn-glycerol-3-phosphate acyltransferase
VLSHRFGLSVDVIGGALGDIPATGPLIVVANHPYGVLDGLTLGRMLSQRRRGDFRILANSVFNRAADINRFILPINFDYTRAAAAQNIATRGAALDYLAGGKKIGVFPGGERVHRGPDAEPAAGPGLAQLHRQDDRRHRRDSRAVILCRHLQPAIPDRQPSER